MSGGLERHHELDAFLPPGSLAGFGSPKTGVQLGVGQPPRMGQVLRRHDLYSGFSLTRMEKEDSNRNHRVELPWFENKLTSS